MKPNKSDVRAKKAYCEYLRNQGYHNVLIIKTPADIKAEKEGDPVPYYFEIKMTNQTDRYFGAATLTEWKQAIETPDHFRFVVVQQNNGSADFVFHEYEPHEFMKYSYVPPFKIYFNINFKEDQPARNEVTAETINLLDDFYKSIKPNK